MHEFFAKIARHAFGKGAAFCYAVTVGVSGQLAYNYLQPRDPTPKPVSIAAPALLPGSPPGAAVFAPIPAGPQPQPAPSTDHAAAPANLASVSGPAAKPKSAPPAATAPILPEPRSLSLPTPAALPTPALKPTALPPSRPAVASPVEPSTAFIDPVQGPAAAGIPDTAVAAPIPLLPSDGAAEIEKAAIPVRPGPGSGGLY